MIFQETKFRSVPETNDIKFVFDNCLVKDTGASAGYTNFGFSGEGKTFYFKASKSGLFDPDGLFVGGITDTEPWKIEGMLDSTTYRYLFNDVPVVSSKPRTSFKTQKFIVEPNNQVFSSDVKFYTNPIDYVVSVDPSFQAQTSLAGKISNESSANIKVFGYSATYYSHDYSVFEGEISGVVSGSDDLNFVLNDISQNKRDEDVTFRVILQTNIGEIESVFTVGRVSGYTGAHHALVKSSDDITISPYFSGVSGKNSFQFTGSQHNSYLFWSYYVFDDDGAAVDKSMRATLTPVAPADGSVYSTKYITGYTVVDGGRYDICPSLEVSGYYSVSGIDFAENSMLFSSGCTGPIPFTLKSTNGFGGGGDGLIFGTYQKYIGIYDSSTYFMVTGIQVVNGGTGYTAEPSIVLNTGIYSNCYDVPVKFGYNVLSFRPFSAEPTMVPIAAYLSGEVLCSGVEAPGAPWVYGLNPYNPYSSTYNYYQVVGIGITNPGFGYDTGNYKTLHRFVRAEGDVEVLKATGNFSFYTGTGLYSFNESWDIETGLVGGESTGLSYVKGVGYSGNVNLEPEEERFYAIVTYNSIDYTGQIVAKLQIQTENGEIITNLITGTNAYSSDPEFLKKNYFDTNYVITGTDEIDLVDYFDGLYTFPDDIIGDDEDL